MKRLFPIALAMIMVLFLAACNGPTTPTAAPGRPAAAPTTSATDCPAAAAVSAAIGSFTYAGPEAEAGADPGVTVCTYNSTGQNQGPALLLSLYPSGTSLQTITANCSSRLTRVSGFGDSAETTEAPTAIWVARSSAPGFSLIAQGAGLSVSQVEAVAKVILTHSRHADHQ